MLAKPAVLTVIPDNGCLWLIEKLQPRDPYKAGAFRIRMTFPDAYPFKPPTIRFITPIYHPNISEKGLLCLPILQFDNWKPATSVETGKLFVRHSLPPKEAVSNSELNPK